MRTLIGGRSLGMSPDLQQKTWTNPRPIETHSLASAFCTLHIQWQIARSGSGRSIAQDAQSSLTFWKFEI